MQTNSKKELRIYFENLDDSKREQYEEIVRMLFEPYYSMCNIEGYCDEIEEILENTIRKELAWSIVYVTVRYDPNKSEIIVSVCFEDDKKEEAVTHINFESNSSEKVILLNNMLSSYINDNKKLTKIAEDMGIDIDAENICNAYVKWFLCGIWANDQGKSSVTIVINNPDGIVYGFGHKLLDKLGLSKDYDITYGAFDPGKRYESHGLYKNSKKVYCYELNVSKENAQKLGYHAMEPHYYEINPEKYMWHHLAYEVFKMDYATSTPEEIMVKVKKFNDILPEGQYMRVNEMVHADNKI